MKILRRTLSIAFVGLAILVAIVSTSSTAEAKPECNCPEVYDPVYITATGQMFSNACFARCAGYGPEDWTSGI